MSLIKFVNGPADSSNINITPHSLDISKNVTVGGDLTVKGNFLSDVGTSTVFEVDTEQKIQIVDTHDSTNLGIGDTFSEIITRHLKEKIELTSTPLSTTIANQVKKTIETTIETLQGPSAPRDLMVTGAPPGYVYLDISWNHPKYSNSLLSHLETGDPVEEYEIQISKNKNFVPIDYLKSDIAGTSTNFKITATEYPQIECTGYFVQIRAKNSEKKWGDYAKYDDYENPTVVSSGEDCFTYPGKEEWKTEISNSYKRILTHIIFEGPTIPFDALDASNTDGSFNDLNFSTETFTIIIKESVTDISMQAFENLKNLNRVVFEASSSAIRVGKWAFRDCYRLKTVDISRTLLDNNGFAAGGSDGTIINNNIGWFQLSDNYYNNYDTLKSKDSWKIPTFITLNFYIHTNLEYHNDPGRLMLWARADGTGGSRAQDEIRLQFQILPDDPLTTPPPPGNLWGNLYRAPEWKYEGTSIRPKYIIPNDTWRGSTYSGANPVVEVTWWAGFLGSTIFTDTETQLLNSWDKLSKNINKNLLPNNLLATFKVNDIISSNDKKAEFDKIYNKGPTITVFKSDNGSIFGGYNRFSWINTTAAGTVAQVGLIRDTSYSDPSYSNFLFNSGFNTWTTYNPITRSGGGVLQKFDRSSCCISGNYIYIGGGDAIGALTERVFRYNIDTEQTEFFPEMNSDMHNHNGRYNHHLEINGNDLYAIGGLSTTVHYASNVDSIEYFDLSTYPSQGTWKRKTGIRVPGMSGDLIKADFRRNVYNSGNDSIIVKDKLYIFSTNRQGPSWGREDAGNNMYYIELESLKQAMTNDDIVNIDLSKCNFSLREEIATNVSLASINDDYIYIIATFNDGNKVYRFSTNTENIEEMASMKQTRVNFTTSVLEGKIYALGGLKDFVYPGYYASDIECFTPDSGKGKWDIIPFTLVRQYHQSVVYKKNIIVLCGFGYSGGIPSRGIQVQNVHTNESIYNMKGDSVESFSPTEIEPIAWKDSGGSYHSIVNPWSSSPNYSFAWGGYSQSSSQPGDLSVYINMNNMNDITTRNPAMFISSNSSRVVYKEQILPKPSNNVWIVNYVEGTPFGNGDRNRTIIDTMEIWGVDNPLSYDIALDSSHELHIPQGVTSVPDKFYSHWTDSNKSLLKKIIFPNSVRTIGVEAFNQIANLTSVTIPTSTTYYPASSFPDGLEVTRRS